MSKGSLYVIGIIVLVIVAGLVFFNLRDQEVDTNIEPTDGQIPAETLSYQQCLETWPSELCGMFDGAERQKLYASCAEVTIPPTADDVSVYPDLKIAVIRWWDDNLQDNIALYAPYEPETNFARCSASVQERLRSLQNASS